MSSSVSLEYLNQVRNIAAVSAQNTIGTTISVILGGTAVPLPSRAYMNGFTVNGASTQFTVTESGAYYIMYGIRTTISLLVSSSVYRNGSSITSLVTTPSVAVASFSCASIVTLTAGDILQLTLYGLLGTAVLSGGTGAYLNVVKINGM